MFNGVTKDGHYRLQLASQLPEQKYLDTPLHCLGRSTGADPGFVLGGGALVSCSTSTPINHIVFFLQNSASCIRKPQVISGGGVRNPLHPPPRSAPDQPALKSKMDKLEAYQNSFPIRKEFWATKCYRQKNSVLLNGSP